MRGLLRIWINLEIIMTFEEMEVKRFMEMWSPENIKSLTGKRVIHKDYPVTRFCNSCCKFLQHTKRFGRIKECTKCNTITPINL